jgi:hypothetical protein
MTAVKWFSDKIKGMDTAVSICAYKELFEQAKEIEKQQKRAEYMRGWKDGLSCKSIKNKMK